MHTTNEKQGSNNFMKFLLFFFRYWRVYDKFDVCNKNHKKNFFPSTEKKWTSSLCRIGNDTNNSIILWDSLMIVAKRMTVLLEVVRQSEEFIQ